MIFAYLWHRVTTVGWPKEAKLGFDIQVGNRNNLKNMPCHGRLLLTLYLVYLHICITVYIIYICRYYIYNIYIWHICILRLDIIYILILYIPQVCFLHIKPYPYIPTLGFESAAHTNSNCPIIFEFFFKVSMKEERHRSQHPLLPS